MPGSGLCKYSLNAKKHIYVLYTYIHQRDAVGARRKADGTLDRRYRANRGGSTTPFSSSFANVKQQG